MEEPHLRRHRGTANIGTAHTSVNVNYIQPHPFVVCIQITGRIKETPPT